MNITKETVFHTAPLVGKLNFPGHTLTILVKGTFEISSGAKAFTAEEQLYPTGDKFYQDDAETHGSPYYESDFVFFKPRSDLLLVGKCYVPGGKPVRMCPVTFQVGDHNKNLIVFGNRRWEKHWLKWRTTDPETFTEMQIRYENSFGGQKYKKNPIGKGNSPVKDDHGNEIRPLPNIEDPAHPVESPESCPEPAGFGPLGRMWQTRHAKTGTYTGDYKETQWPWFPEDFDWSHFNAAPPEMQVDGYLRGDEKLYFENLHPEHSQYHSQLPGMRVRCFLNKRAESGEPGVNFEEISMNLDTLWVDMEAEKLVLVWRGWAQVLSEEYEEVEDLFILSEPLDQPPASLEECRKQFLDRRAEEEKEWAMEPEKPEAQPDEAAESAAPAREKPDIDPAWLKAQTNAILAQMGIDPESLPPEAREKQSRLIQKLTETDPAKAAEMEQKELDDQMREAFAKLDLDPDHLPPVSANAKAEQLRLMKELGLKPADMTDNPEFSKILALMGAALPKMGLDPENLTPLIEQAKKQQERLRKQFGAEEKAETGPAKDKEGQPLTRETVRERAARGESFTGENLHGLDLSGLDLSNLDFSGAELASAILTGARLQSAILAGADLTEADLSEADLSGANLVGADLSKAKMKQSALEDADFTGCIAIGADLTGAALTDAVFEKARMAGAVLGRVEAAGANLSEADLTGCSLRESSWPGADFSKAVLDNADFQGADLSNASMEGAVGRKINLTDSNLAELRASEGCDFTGGIFWNASGPGSNWEKADLTESDFRGSRMEGAVFTSACLKGADLSSADMKFGRFYKADLQQARLIQVNLFQGSLEKADLTGADLRGSNMYGVEFLDAITENIRTEGTNLKMSKLQERMKQA